MSKVCIIDSRVGIPALTEVQAVINHLHILQDDLTYQLDKGYIDPGKVCHYVRSKYSQLILKANNYLRDSVNYIDALNKLEPLERAGLVVWYPHTTKRLNCSIRGIHVEL